MNQPEPITIEEMYGAWGVEADVVDAALERSLAPRSSSVLYDAVGALGIGPQHTILDIGGRDARHSLALVERFGCRSVSVDPVESHVQAARDAVASHPQGNLVEIRPGTMEEIPAQDAEFDLIFCRDVFSHISHADVALAECRRVLKPDGHLISYQTFATELLEPAESIRLYADLAIVPHRMIPEDFERHALGAGFVIESVDLIGSEWREYWEEDGTDLTSKQLLHSARLIRARGELTAELGEIPYRVELANALWGVYQMIGKLEPRIYVLGGRE